MPAIGIAVEAIALNAFGRVMQVGLIENIDTNAFVEGNVLFVSATVAGALTATAPLYPNIRQEVGTVLVKSVGAGAIQVVARSMSNEGILDHGGTLGLADDDHLQYYHLTGIRPLTADLNMGGYDINFDAPDDFIDYKGSAPRHFALYLGGIEQFRVAGSQTAYVDVLNELTAATGVTVDGVLCKDGVVPDSAYPNAFLLDCSRAVAGHLLPDASLTRNLGSGSKRWANLYVAGIYPTEITQPSANTALGLIKAWTTGYGSLETVAQIHAGGATFDIPRAGDITMLAQKMMQFGTYTDAQRPAAGTAGRVIFNTDDGNLNIDDGTNWILPDGTTT